MYTAAYIWAGVLRALEETFSPEIVAQYFCDLDVIVLDEENLILYTPSLFRQEQIRHQFAEPIMKILLEDFHMQPTLRFTQHRPPETPSTDAFRPGFTLDSFLPGENNRFAHCAARAVASESGGKIYNPLLIYGPSGVGKTHLLHAIANATRSRDPQARVRYLRSEELTQDLIEAIQADRSQRFGDHLLETDLLLVDDLQFLAGKPATQEEFYKLFHQLAQQGCQIVLASDQPPQNLKHLADRLVAQFPWALIADLSIPEPEVRGEILRRGARERRLQLESEHIDYIQTHMITGGQQLAGVLNILHARGNCPDMEQVRQAVAALLPTAPKDADGAAVTQSVCDLFQITPEALRDHSHGKRLGSARLAAVYLLEKICRMPLCQIAEILDRDPGTILHLLCKAQREMDLQPAFREQIQSLADKIRESSQNTETAP